MATLSTTDQPVNTVVGTTASYTVPVGKWAVVKLTASCTAKVTVPLTSTVNNISQCPSVNCGNMSLDIVLKSGDIITSSLVNASGTVSGNNNTIIAGSSETTASISINSTVFAVCRAAVGIGTGGGAMTATFSGTSSVGYLACEYNNTFS